MQKQSIGEMLMAANLIDEVQMKVALAEQQRTHNRFGSTLVELKFVDENVLVAFLSKQIDVPCISLLNIDIPRKVLRRLPARVARECQAIPIRVENGLLEVAMVDPTDVGMIRVIEAAVGTPIKPLIASQSSIQKMVERIYRDDAGDDTVAAQPVNAAGASNPLFDDLILELESGDFEQRLDRIEVSLGQIWVLLEKVLRRLESEERSAPKHVPFNTE